jgi:hypothetical protein
MKDAQIAELLLQALETEMGGTQVYMTAVKCATNEDLWIESLGLPAVLPPPEEKKDVKTAIGAARVKQTPGQLVNG